MVGAMYCMMPMVENFNSLAPKPKSISGTAVAGPHRTRSSMLSGCEATKWPCAVYLPSQTTPGERRDAGERISTSRKKPWLGPIGSVLRVEEAVDREGTGERQRYPEHAASFDGQHALSPPARHARLPPSARARAFRRGRSRPSPPSHPAD